MITFSSLSLFFIVYLYLLAVNGGYENNILAKFFSMYPFKGSVFIMLLPLIGITYSLKKSIEIIKVNEAIKKSEDGNIKYEIKDQCSPEVRELLNNISKIKEGYSIAVEDALKNEKLKTELISNVSHDLKTPLTSIITYIDLLKNDNITDEERKSYIDTIDNKSQRLKFLIEDLFEVSKATSGNIKLNPVNVDIIELIRQIEIELSDKLDNAKVVVKNNFPDNKIFLNLDSQKTFRIFENLLNNVAKYSMEGSRVYVDITENEQDVTINIKNMSAVEIDYKSDEIIERFQRGDKSRNTEGSGLGLAIVKSFVEAQGGIFKVEIDGDLFKSVVIFMKKQ